MDTKKRSDGGKTHTEEQSDGSVRVVKQDKYGNITSDHTKKDGKVYETGGRRIK